jgi:dTDP-4-dehydrorhamnose 3,5-epimerase
MEIVPTEIPGVLVVRTPCFGDDRGFFSEVYRDTWLPGLTFVQDNHSRSAAAGTVRGLHFQIPPFAQDKLVRVARGAVYDVAVDIRHGSPTFGRHAAVVLSEENWDQLLVPRGFAHGFCTLEPHSEVLYKVTAHYSAEHDRGLRWDDPGLGIDWPVDAGAAVLSDKDRAWPSLAQMPEHFSYDGGGG